MVKRASFLLALGLVSIFAGPLLAHPFLIGFSGAPGTYGVCMYACHGIPGGSLNIRWFPARYQPGQTYRLTVGGGSVDNFNCSVRVGRGSVNAGLITADFGTETYWDTVETNGVHALGACDTCNFLWTAPPSGTDTVRLYFSGTQEGGFFGADSVLVSAEFTGVEEEIGTSGAFSTGLKNTPNPFVSFTTLPGHASERFALYDISGRRVGTYKGDRIGFNLSAGVYFLKAENSKSKPLRIVKIR